VRKGIRQNELAEKSIAIKKQWVGGTIPKYEKHKLITIVTVSYV
jgi:hypothetical protein